MRLRGARLRLIFAAFASALLTAVTVMGASAQWPATCVELNDLAEARSGNDHNVGIYQRVFGDQAEAACQREHRGNLRLLLGGRPYEQPYKADPAGYTQAFVERAIGRYNTEGRQATLDYYNSSASVDGSWYVFIAEVDGVMLAHGVIRDLVGRVFADIRSADGCI